MLPLVHQETGYVDIICSDAFRLMQQAGITTVASATAGQDTGTRIGKILDQVSWPTSMRTIDTGNTTCIADPGTSRTALDALKNCEFSEQGAFYIDVEGTAIFLNRTNVIKKYGETPIEFNQTTGIPYTNLTFAFDDKLIINSAGMTRYGGTQQVSEDSASIAKYFPHQINENNLVLQTDADALNVAKIYVATRKETTIRIDAMTVDLLDPDVPELPLVALVPEEPEVPVSPDEPVAPDVPLEPDVRDEPLVPLTPLVPIVPEEPEEPDVELAAD